MEKTEVEVMDSMKLIRLVEKLVDENGVLRDRLLQAQQEIAELREELARTKATPAAPINPCPTYPPPTPGDIPGYRPWWETPWCVNPSYTCSVRGSSGV